MKEAQFTLQREADWKTWDQWLQYGQRDSRKKSAIKPSTATSATPFPAAEMPHRFRALCSDLSLARARNYSAPLLDNLQDRVWRAQQKIYGAQPQLRHAWLHFLISGFPALVREQWRFVVPALLLFFIPLFGYIAAAHFWPESVYLVIPPESAAEYVGMYTPDAQRLGSRHGADSNFAMLGMYIWNNVRIDFQCFAAGLLFGLGSVFFLLYNGLVIGAVAGHLTQVGLIETFWGFVAGHSSFELIGASLSGAAGLMMGYALIAPGNRSRGQALRAAAKIAVRLLYGAAVMTFCAAFIEAFWSPLRTIPVTLKYTVGITLWLLLSSYFLFAGRKRSTHRSATTRQDTSHAA